MKKILPLLLVSACLITAQAFAAGTEESGGATAPGFNATGFPIVDQPVTINVVWQRWGSHVKAPDEMILMQRVREQTGVDVNWIAVDSAAWQEKTNLMLASGDLPDTFGSPLSDYTIISNGEAGSFIRLNELIEDYGHNLRDQLERKPSLKAWLTAPNGDIYALPKLNEGSWVTVCPISYLNKLWLDDMGESVPTTTDEFYDLMVKVKNAGDLNGNGKADEIPYSFKYEDCAGGLASFFWAHGLPTRNGEGGNNAWIVIRDSKVIFAPNEQGFKDTAKYLNRLWEAGVLDEESFSQDHGRWSAKYKQNQLMAFPNWWVQNEVDKSRWLDWEYMPALKAPGYEPSVSYRFGWSRGLAPITVAAKHPEVVMRWIDSFYEPEMSIQVMEGPLGVRTEKKADGTFNVLPTPEGLGLSEWRDSETIGPGFITSIDEGMYLNLFLFEAAEMCGTIKIRYYKEDWPEQFWPNPMFTSEQITEENKYLPDVKAIVSKTLARRIVEGNADAEWDKFQKDLDDAGLPKLMAIWQDNMDKFLAGTGGTTPRPHEKGLGTEVSPY